MTDEIEPKRGRGRPRKAFDAVENVGEEVEKHTHVTMKRDPQRYAGPHTAHVHVHEVSNWSKFGWEVAD